MNTMNELLKLNSEELSVLEKYVKKGEDFVNVEDEHLQQVYAALIDKASALQDELDAYDEVMAEPGCDLLHWYHKKVKDNNGA